MAPLPQSVERYLAVPGAVAHSVFQHGARMSPVVLARPRDRGRTFSGWRAVRSSSPPCRANTRLRPRRVTGSMPSLALAVKLEPVRSPSRRRLDRPNWT
jgi:hypothetical protein